MSSIRGRSVRVGGVQFDPQGASGRTEPGPGNQPITRPAYRISGGGQFQPAGVADGVGGGGGRRLLDLSTVSGWRLVAVIAALFYIGAFYFTISPRGVAGGVRL